MNGAVSNLLQFPLITIIQALVSIVKANQTLTANRLAVVISTDGVNNFWVELMQCFVLATTVNTCLSVCSL